MASTKLTTAFFEIAAWEKKYIQQQLASMVHSFYAGRLNKNYYAKLKDIQILSVFINSPVPVELINAMPKLKLIVTRSTGYDHIDIKAAQAKGVAVLNVPFYGENTVAEQTFGLLLNISRRISEGVERTRDGRFDPHGLTGFDLLGKTIGIVGLGHIGQYAAKMAHGFGMKIVAYDVIKDQKFAKQYGIRFLSLNQLLKVSDIVSVHAPLNKYTFHMLNADNMKSMKKGAVLINTARGPLVDTRAMYKLLENKHLRAVGLDVLEEEDVLAAAQADLPKHKEDELSVAILNQRLMDHPRAFVTPHNAFNTDEALQRIIGTTVSNIKSWQKGRMVNKVSSK